MAKKGQHVWTGVKDEEFLSKGVYKTYTEENLRYSQTVPLTMYEEKNSGCNLPAQIDIYATDGAEYKFLFVAKGGGSANKNMLYQETKALLNPVEPRKIPGGKDDDSWYGRMPTLPRCLRDRRHIGRGLS